VWVLLYQGLTVGTFLITEYCEEGVSLQLGKYGTLKVCVHKVVDYRQFGQWNITLQIARILDFFSCY